MFCPTCGKQVGDDFSYCPFCGHGLPRVGEAVTSQGADASVQAYYVDGEVASDMPADGASSSSGGTGGRAVSSVEKDVSTTPALGMKWYKLVIWALLFLAAVLFALLALTYFVNVSYPSLRYTLREGLQVLDTLTGALLLALAAASISVRMELAHYKQMAPLHYLIVAGVAFAAPTLYVMFESIISSDGETLYLKVDALATLLLLMGIAFVLANKRYFDKRIHLFDK